MTIVTLTPNPALDVTISVDAVAPGTSHRVAPAARRLGGKGVNVARVLAAEGRSVVAQGPLRADSASEDPAPEDTAADAGGPAAPQWDFTETPVPVRRSYSLVEGDGRATLFNETGKAHPEQVWEAVLDRLRRVLEQVREQEGPAVLVVSGSLPPGLAADFPARCVQIAHRCGAATVVDTSGPGLREAARAGADWLKPNDEELAALFGPLPVAEAAARLCALGAGRVLASRGAAGMSVVDGAGELLRARLRTPLVGNPTGAGDAVVAALAAGLAEEHDPPSAASDPRTRPGDLRGLVARAAAWGAAAVTEPVAGAISVDWRRHLDAVELHSLRGA